MKNMVNYEIGDLFIKKGCDRIIKEDREIKYLDDCVVMENGYFIDNCLMDYIYQLCGYDIDGYKINQICNYGITCEFYGLSLEDINKRFIKLFDFLNDSKFVGREFRRTKPIYRYSNVFINTGFVRGIGRTMIGPKKIIADSSFMDSIQDSSKIIILYMKDNILLAKKIENNNFLEDKYMIIGYNYTMDGNYEFIGDVYEEYRDRNMVYSEIVEQINNYNKKKYVKARKK